MPAPPPSRNPREGSKSRAASSGQKRSKLKLRRVRSKHFTRVQASYPGAMAARGEAQAMRLEPLYTFFTLSVHLFTLFLCIFHPICVSFTLFVRLSPYLCIFSLFLCVFHPFCVSFTLFVRLSPFLCIFHPRSLCIFHPLCTSFTLSVHLFALFVRLSPFLCIFYPLCTAFTLFVYLSPSLYVFHPLCASFFINLITSVNGQY